MSKNVAVLQPGFVTGPESMGAAAKSIERHGLADEVLLGMSLAHAIRDPAEFARMIDGKAFIGHSAAEVALREANRVEPTKRPAEVIAFCPPERVPIVRLTTSALRLVVRDSAILASGRLNRKVVGHLLRDRTHQLTSEAAMNARLAFDISDFSTIELLRAAADAGVRGTIVSVDRDEFFPQPYCCHDFAAKQPTVVEVAGYHNQFVYEPDTILGQLDCSEAGRLHAA